MALLATIGTAWAQEAAPESGDTTEAEAASVGEQAGGVVLPTIQVTGASEGVPPAFAGGQVATGANLGILGNMDYMEAPFSITSYTDQLIREKQVTELRDIAMLEPSLNVFYTRGNYNNGFMLRGFPAQLRFDGLKGPANYDIQTDAYERVEIVEGPNALLFGDFGGSAGRSTSCPSARATSR